MEKPNLFAFATSELSQDAFICWLLSWADPKYADDEPALNKTAIHFLDRLFDLGRVRRPTRYETVVVQKQHFQIDVFVSVNSDFGIVIEDKTFTKQHSGQLERYVSTATKTLPKENVAFIYIKTGDQSSYADVEAAGFSCFRRQDFLNVLELARQSGVTNEILRDFHTNLLALEERVNSYKSTSVYEWGSDWNCWAGFFMELRKRLGDGEWDYVANASGGFMGFWWHWRDGKYLQLEESRLCFKIEVEDKALQASRWEGWHSELMQAVSGDMKIKRPTRRRNGTWMTVAFLEGDYRRADEKGVLDFDQTIRVLIEAQAQLDAAVDRARAGQTT